MDTSENARLRPPPENRFAQPSLLVNLDAVAATLRAEPNAGERGHRQATVYKHGNTTVALFVFDRFSHLQSHVAQGEVTMHVLKGWVKITADSTEYELKAGEMLAVAPGVRHAIKAEEESQVLVTVHLEP